MKSTKFALVVLVALMLVSAGSARADMIGYTVQATAFFPTVVGPTVGGPVTAVVGAGPEFLDGQFGAFFGPTFDFGADTITITHRSTAHQQATFNGYQFTDILGLMPDFTGFTVISDTTGFFSGDPSRLFFDTDNLWVNFQGLSFRTADEVVVLGVTSVPEPASLLLLGTGLIGAVRAVRRKRS